MEQLFQYAVILRPTEKQAKKDVKSKIIVSTTEILAESEQLATMMIVRKLPKEHEDQLSQIDILIRPF
jgi:hypothetical protein